jgi:hypothetical protein
MNESIAVGRPVGSTYYNVNDDFFKRPDLLNSYWAGFIAADGALSSGRNNVRIGINKKDVEHLVALKYQSLFEGPIREYEDIVVLEVYSKPWRQDLARNFFVTPQKTHTLVPPSHLSYTCTIAYIAGYIDGDGWRTKSRNTPAIGFQGNENVVRWITGFLNTYFPATRKNTVPAKRADAKCWQSTIYGYRVLDLTRAVKRLDLPLLARKWYE